MFEMFETKTMEEKLIISSIYFQYATIFSWKILVYNINNKTNSKKKKYTQFVFGSHVRLTY